MLKIEFENCRDGENDKEMLDNDKEIWEEENGACCLMDSDEGSGKHVVKTPDEAKNLTTCFMLGSTNRSKSTSTPESPKTFLQTASEECLKGSNPPNGFLDEISADIQKLRIDPDDQDIIGATVPRICAVIQAFYMSCASQSGE